MHVQTHPTFSFPVIARHENIENQVIAMISSKEAATMADWGTPEKGLGQRVVRLHSAPGIRGWKGLS